MSKRKYPSDILCISGIFAFGTSIIFTITFTILFQKFIEVKLIGDSMIKIVILILQPFASFWIIFIVMLNVSVRQFYKPKKENVK